MYKSTRTKDCSIFYWRRRFDFFKLEIVVQVPLSGLQTAYDLLPAAGTIENEPWKHIWNIMGPQTGCALMAMEVSDQKYIAR